MIDTKGLLMIEPSERGYDVPLIDKLTRQMTAAWRSRRTSEYGYRGFHVCRCGANSDNRDHWVMVAGQELLTNSLCIHYLAFHRQEVPVEELAKVSMLDYGESDPTEEELVSVKK